MTEEKKLRLVTVLGPTPICPYCYSQNPMKHISLVRQVVDVTTETRAEEPIIEDDMGIYLEELFVCPGCQAVYREVEDE